MSDRAIPVGAVTIRVRRQGDGRGVLLLRRFPQTLEMWDAVAERFAVVCADLPGYADTSARFVDQP